MLNLPKQEQRVETGPIKFGGDWLGVFVRGDDCMQYDSVLRKMRNDLNHTGAAGYVNNCLTELIELFSSAIERGKHA